MNTILTHHPRSLISLMPSLLQPSLYLTLTAALRLPPQSVLPTIPWMTQLPHHPALRPPCEESTQFTPLPLRTPSLQRSSRTRSPPARFRDHDTDL